MSRPSWSCPLELVHKTVGEKTSTNLKLTSHKDAAVKEVVLNGHDDRSSDRGYNSITLHNLAQNSHPIHQRGGEKTGCKSRR